MANIAVAKKKPQRKLRATSTSSFGTVTRQGHDSSSFYDKKIYSSGGITSMLNGGGKVVSGSSKTITKKRAVKAKQDANLTPDNLLEFPTNIIYCDDSRNMHQIPANSVGLMITSPPYNVGKEYDEDLSLAEYSELLKGVFADTHRVLCHGGRACINIANIGRKPYIPLHMIVIKIMDELGFLMRGEIIWDKAASAGGSCAWGSWKSASNPVLRDVHEYILVFSKESYSRPNGNGQKKTSTITDKEFLEYTKSIWTFNATSARKAGHPAPFPVELPRRLIELYSFKGDIILDPFMGSGSTAIAAMRNDRKYIGYDISADYVKLANKNIVQAQEDFIKEKEKISMKLPFSIRMIKS